MNRLLRLRWLSPVGSLPAALGLERAPLAAVAAGVLVLAARLAVPPLPGWVALPAGATLGAWLALQTAHAGCFALCRRLSRAAGLRTLVVVPESAWLLARLCGRLGIPVPRGRQVFALHVDECWRPPARLGPPAAVRCFGRLYRQDYDRLLRAFAGRPVLLASSTFNRHESPWTRRAIAAGWCCTRRGPLFPAAPGRHGPGARRAAQRRMFGGQVSGRRIDRPEAWRTRLFDCGMEPERRARRTAADRVSIDMGGWP